MSKVKTLVNSLSCFIILFSIVSIVLIIITTYLYSGDYSIANTVIDNFNSGLINDIYFDSNCPDKNKFIHYYFPGTTHGCNCHYTLKTGSCSKDDKFCWDVYSISSSELTVWRKEDICLSRSELTYKDLWYNSAAKNSECDTGYKQCGTLDTTGNKLCIDRTKECPVNSIKIVDAQTDPADNYLQLYNGKYINFNRNNIDSAQIPIEFKVYETNACAYSSEVLKSADEYYKLESKSMSYVYDCSILESETAHNSLGTDSKYKFDPTYTLLDSDTKYEFYNENSILNKVSALPNYPTSALRSIIMKLMYRNYIGISRECHSSFANPDIVEGIMFNMKSLYKFLIVVLVLSIIIMIFSIYLSTKFNDFTAYLISQAVFLFFVIATLLIIKKFIFIPFDTSLLKCFDDYFSELFGYLLDSYMFKTKFISVVSLLYLLVIGFSLIITVVFLFIGNEMREELFSKETEVADGVINNQAGVSDSEYKRLE